MSSRLYSPSLAVTPEAFCARMQAELSLHSPDDGWVRGARALCEMYASTDARRFETILTEVTSGRASSALADRGRWLLSRWKLAQTQP